MELTPDQEKKNVFIVDDHPLIREWLATLIRQQPDLAVCGEAETAFEAFQAISQLRPAVAIVDISLKDGSGLELVKDITTLRPPIAAIVLSVHDERLYAERALRAGARGYVMKGENAGSIIAFIRQVIAGKLCFSPQMTAIFMEKFLAGHALAGGSPTQPPSDEEREIFRLIGLGWSLQQIAEALHTSVETVQVHCARIQEKFQLDSVAELVREAIRRPESPQKK